MNTKKIVGCTLCKKDGSCDYCGGDQVIGGLDLKQTYYTVQKGDTYHSIAMLFYGKQSDYVYIQNANRDKPLVEGNKLFIPTKYAEKARYI